MRPFASLRVTTSAFVILSEAKNLKPSRNLCGPLDELAYKKTSRTFYLVAPANGKADLIMSRACTGL
jgi:hypothetical protein